MLPEPDRHAERGDRLLGLACDDPLLGAGPELPRELITFAAAKTGVVHDGDRTIEDDFHSRIRLVSHGRFQNLARHGHTLARPASLGHRPGQERPSMKSAAVPWTWIGRQLLP